MNSSVTLAKVVASSIFPESTRHLIRCLNRNREQMRPVIFQCERTAFCKCYWDISTTYRHWSWCEFYYRSVCSTINQVPSLLLYVHLLLYNTIKYNSSYFMKLEMFCCLLTLWCWRNALNSTKRCFSYIVQPLCWSVWTKYSKDHELNGSHVCWPSYLIWMILNYVFQTYCNQSY